MLNFVANKFRVMDYEQEINWLSKWTKRIIILITLHSFILLFIAIDTNIDSIISDIKGIIKCLLW